jgi:hypothetical protein
VLCATFAIRDIITLCSTSACANKAAIAALACIPQIAHTTHDTARNKGSPPLPTRKGHTPQHDTAGHVAPLGAQGLAQITPHYAVGRATKYLQPSFSDLGVQPFWHELQCFVQLSTAGCICHVSCFRTRPVHPTRGFGTIRRGTKKGHHDVVT